MDWVAAQWQVLAGLALVAVAWGRIQAGQSEARREQAALRGRLEALELEVRQIKDGDALRREQLVREIGEIKITLARLEEKLDHRMAG